MAISAFSPGRTCLTPAAEWGAEYGRFLKACGAERLSATVLLPRRMTSVGGRDGQP